MSLQNLVEMSHFYGNTAGYVLGGGGNTSYKNASTLWVKSSGQSLATITPEGFVALDRAKVRQVLTQSYPSTVQEREALVLSNLLESRLFPLGRPSVETFLHELMDFPYVVHTHPATVNSLTCAVGGRTAVERLFPEAVWVGYTDPGYLLATDVALLVKAVRKTRRFLPQILFLENHGLVVAGSSPEEIQAIHKRIFTIIPPVELEWGSLPSKEQTRPIEDLLNVTLSPTGTSLSFAWAPPTASEPNSLGSAFTPDHIVYMGVRPLFSVSSSDLTRQIDLYKAEFGRNPRVAVIQGVGTITFAANAVGAGLALALFGDAAAIAQGSKSFGGPQFLDASSIEFILNWEAEHFRSKTSGVSETRA